MRLSLDWAKRVNLHMVIIHLHYLESFKAGCIKDLRAESIEGLKNIGFDGFAIGGLSVMGSQRDMLNVLDGLLEFLPEDKPRYLMGVKDTAGYCRGSYSWSGYV